VGDVPKTMSLAQYLAKAGGNSELPFEKMDFMDPFLIVYSSGKFSTCHC
jgi:acetoacetyl-CoA synthetase